MVGVDCAQGPDNQGDEEKGPSRQEHQTVALVPAAVCNQGQHLMAEDRAAAQEFPAKGHCHQDKAVAHAVAQAVDKGFERGVAHGKPLGPAHHNTVGDDQAHIDGKLFSQIIKKGLEDLVYQDNQGGDHRDLDADAHRIRDLLADQADDQAGKGYHQRETDRHDQGCGHGSGHCQGRADPQHQQGNGVALKKWVEEEFAFFLRHRC